MFISTLRSKACMTFGIGVYILWWKTSLLKVFHDEFDFLMVHVLIFAALYI